jgi:bla regulator protein BlaR1
MALPIIYGNTTDRLLGALCNTLIHSLWQGTVLAAVAGLIVIFTRRTSSALRYNLLVCALLLFAIGAGVTFTWQYQHSTVQTAFVQPVQHIDHSPVQIQPAQVQAAQVFSYHKEQPSPSLPERWENYLSDHHNTIVFIWFLIVCARCLQLAFGLYGTYRLRRVQVFAVDGEWNKRLQQLADGLHIKQAIRLLESGIAKVPMVIGHLKPVILAPIGLLTALSAEEVEAILVHELAHIKRRDYLVNMLQSLVEIVFFFNPAVLWVSKMVRTERENCCDDMVLAQNNNKLNYIRALVSCDQYRSEVPAYAMGLPGSKNTLLSRAKRMATNSNYSLNLFEKTILAVCLVVLGLGISAFTAREPIQKALKSVIAAIHHGTAAKDKAAKSDTTKKQLTVQNGMIEKFRENTPKTTGNVQLDALIHKIDSLKGNPDNASSYLSKFGKPDTGRYTQMVKDLLAEKNRPDSNLLKNLLVDKRWENSPMLARLMAKLDSSSKVFTAVANDLYRDHILSNTSHLNITLNEKELIVNGVRLPQDMHDRYYSKYGNKFDDSNYSSNNTDGNTGSGRTYANNNTMHVGDAKKPTQGNVNLQGEDEKTRNIINDMLKDGIITGTDDLSFKIGTTEFVVNYKKQPDAVYQKYKAKYVPAHKKGDWIWFYKFDTEKWEKMTGRKNSADFEGTATGVFQGKEDGNSGGYKNGYSGGYNDGDYYRQNESQKKYWDGQQWKLIDEIKRDGLANNETVFSFSLSDKRFVINGAVQSDEVFKKYYREYAPANPGPNWDWSYYNRWDAYSDSLRNARNKAQAEIDKKLVADLLQDRLITDPNNVTFTLNDKAVTINGKKQSEEVHKKYKEKYMPANYGSGWNWTYSHHE